ncbi:MAG: hypothetical protein NC328_05235 [Muribaculum sp.]|nr:hypothetical protein [Muribaculum sp.]
MNRLLGKPPGQFLYLATLMVLAITITSFLDEDCPAIFRLSAKKVSLKLKKTPADAESSVPNGFERIHRNDTDSLYACAHILDNIIVSGYDKPTSSSKESFFISNHNEFEVSDVIVEIHYYDLQERRLHRRETKINVQVPPGETVKADIPSWDSQHSFHYHLSQPAQRKPSSPYKVRIMPLSLLAPIKSLPTPPRIN